MSRVDEHNVLELINQIDELPTLPGVIRNLLELLKSPDVNATDIGKALSVDIALSSKILKIVNSAFYGFSKKISTITHAIVILGFNAIKSAILGVSVIKAFSSFAEKQKTSLLYREFWSHAIGCGAASRAIVKHLGLTHLEEAFMAGILHDIGKLIFNQYFYKDYNEALLLAAENKMFLYEAEREVFNIDHTRVGSYLINEWNFPDDLSQSINYHHFPEYYNGDNQLTKRLIDVVHIANVLTKALEIGSSGYYYMTEINRDSMDNLGLTTDDFSSLLSEIKMEYRCSSEFLNIVRED